MRKERARVEDDFEDEHGGWRCAQKQDGGTLDERGERNLERVKPDAGRDVEVEVGVVAAVHPPQPRHRVEQPVLEVHRQVEHDHGNDALGPG